MNCDSILLFGLGYRREHRADRALAVAKAALESAASLGAKSLTCGLFGLDELPSPLARTGNQLLEVLGAASDLSKITVAANPEQQSILMAQYHSEL